MIAYKALQDGEISGYPEYTSTLLTSIFGKEANQVPADAQQAYEQAKQELEPKGGRPSRRPPSPTPTRSGC